MLFLTLRKQLRCRLSMTSVLAFADFVAHGQMPTRLRIPQAGPRRGRGAILADPAPFVGCPDAIGRRSAAETFEFAWALLALCRRLSVLRLAATRLLALKARTVVGGQMPFALSHWMGVCVTRHFVVFRCYAPKSILHKLCGAFQPQIMLRACGCMRPFTGLHRGWQGVSLPSRRRAATT